MERHRCCTNTTAKRNLQHHGYTYTHEPDIYVINARSLTPLYLHMCANIYRFTTVKPTRVRRQHPHQESGSLRLRSYPWVSAYLHPSETSVMMNNTSESHWLHVSLLIEFFSQQRRTVAAQSTASCPVSHGSQKGAPVLEKDTPPQGTRSLPFPSRMINPMIITK